MKDDLRSAERLLECNQLLIRGHWDDWWKWWYVVIALSFQVPRHSVSTFFHLHYFSNLLERKKIVFLNKTCPLTLKLIIMNSSTLFHELSNRTVPFFFRSKSEKWPMSFGRCREVSSITWRIRSSYFFISSLFPQRCRYIDMKMMRFLKFFVPSFIFLHHISTSWSNCSVMCSGGGGGNWCEYDWFSISIVQFTDFQTFQDKVPNLRRRVSWLTWVSQFCLFKTLQIVDTQSFCRRDNLRRRASAL